MTSKPDTPIIHLSSSSSKGKITEKKWLDLSKFDLKIFSGLVLVCSSNVSVFFLMSNFLSSDALKFK